MYSQNKIILLKNNLTKIGGLEKYTHKIAEGFSKKGLEVTVLTSHPIKKPYFKTILIPSSSGPSFLKILHFNFNCNKWLEKQKPKLIFGLERNSYQTHYRAGNGCHYCYLQSRKFTDTFFKRCSFSINPLHKAILSLEKKAFEHPALQTLFTNSHMVKKQILDRYQIKESKIKVVHNGVTLDDKDFYSWQEDRPSLLNSHAIDPNNHIFLFIANNYQRKGLDLILKSLSLLKEKEFSLIVIGKDKNIDRYKQIAKKLKIEKKIHFLGPQKDPTPFYKMSDTLLIPSFYDPFANVTVEALAMGLFVISSNQNGAHEILNDQIGITLNNFPNLEEMTTSMQIAMKKPKTRQTSLLIRDQVKHLDFSHQVGSLVEKTLANL